MVVPNKRKRKDANRIEISPEITKRVKVHAQRKFAQGALCPPIILPFVEPSKDEPSKPQHTVTSRNLQIHADTTSTKRPKTEDFLTFLCFRGTPMLPTSLDFLNYPHRNSELVQNGTYSKDSSNNNNVSTTTSDDLSTNVLTSPTTIPTNFIPFGVRKRASVYPEKNTSLKRFKTKKSNESNKSYNYKDNRNENQIKIDKTRQHRVTVQALRQKYQEQKMAKLRAVAFSKISNHSVRTRSCSNVSKVLPAKRVTDKCSMVIAKPKSCFTKATTLPNSNDKLKTAPIKFLQKTSPLKAKNLVQSNKIKMLAKRRMCLRSSKVSLSRPNDKLLRPLPDRKPLLNTKKLNRISRNIEKQVEKVLEISKSEKAFKDEKVKEEAENDSFKEFKEPKKLVVKLIKEPELKNKDSIIAKHTRQLRKSNSLDSKKKFIGNNKNMSNEKPTAKTESISEFSSDDDEPLLRVTDRNNKKSKANNDGIKQLNKLLYTENKSIGDNTSKRKENIIPEEKIKPGTKKNFDVMHQQTSRNTKIFTPKEEVNNKTKVTDVSNDDSDVSKRAMRPSRKTKEAATLYMELLGQRLNTFNNFDDDNSSMDSFPELPNVRKIEQMENELKAQAIKTSKTTSTDSGIQQIIKHEKNEISSARKDLDKKEPDLDCYSNSETPSESEGQLSLYELNGVNIDKSYRRCNLRSDKSTVLSEGKPDIKSKAKSVKIKKKASANNNIFNKTKLEDKKTKINSKKNKINEKSFSDSDEEPLALKISTKSKSDNETNQKSCAQSEKSSKITTEKEDQLDISEALKKISTMKKCMEARKKVEHLEIKLSEEFSTNPVPSFEESQKIFGIAKRSQNVSDDVKNPLYNKLYQKPTSRDVELKIDLTSQRNKRKVNMSSEEIEKWLNESCCEPEPMEDDLVMSDIEIKKFKEIMEDKKKFFDKPIITKDFEKGKAEKKTIFHQRRSTKTPPNKSTSVRNKQAFSPDNETSVYSFCLDDQIPPSSTPFRQKFEGKRKSESEQKSEENSKTKGNERKRFTMETKINNFTPPKVVAITKICETQSCDTIDLNYAKHSENALSQSQIASSKKMDLEKTLENLKSSIAVQCDFQNDQQATKITLPQGNLTDFQNMEISTQTDYALANEGHLFYIPLQNSKTGENISEHLIQGVAVKLGTEGPDGPNQRVIMRAKLVTKAQMSSTSNQSQLATLSHETLTALSPSEDSLIMAKKTICDLPKNRRSNPPLVGTVQPLARDERLLSNTVNNSGSILQNVGTQGSQFKSYLKEMGTQKQIEKSTINERKIDLKFKVDANVTLNSDLKKTVLGEPIMNASKTSASEMLDAPTFYPSEKQFMDPIAFIEQITPIASKFGLCRIVPPASFKPDCKVSDDMRFTAYNQYVNRMMYRFGPSVQELLAIKKYLETQSITLTHAPYIGGMEIDLPRLYHTVQDLGGLKEVIEKKKWHRVAEEMCIPKSAQDRVTKLDDIYCKYLLPYDTLSSVERQKLLSEVKEEWSRKENLYRQKQHEKNQHYKQFESDNYPGNDRDTDSESNNSGDDFDSETDRDLRECTLKGRNMALSQFFRIARNTMSVWFKNGPPDPAEVEKQYWGHVSHRDKHICVHVGSIDSSGFGYGFPNKGSPVAKHPWNLKVLTNNDRSVLRSLGPVMGLTVPTLHVGMLFSACCWYRDPHGLPWIEYLHTGANKIWYGIPDRASNIFRNALSVLAPQSVLPQTIWLPSDSAMIPPGELLSRNVPLSRTVQRPGEFVLVCPRAYTSSLCTGYTVSESVYYATTDWLDSAQQDFQDIQESREPTMFSLDQLLVSIASDSRAQDIVLKSILEPFQQLVEREMMERNELLRILSATSDNNEYDNGKNSNYQRSSDSELSEKNNSIKIKELKDKECDVCRANLYLSMVSHKEEDSTMCLRHAIRFLKKKKQKISNENSKINGKAKKITISEIDFLTHWQLVYSYSLEDLQVLYEKVKNKLDHNISVVQADASNFNGGKCQTRKKKKK